MSNGVKFVTFESDDDSWISESVDDQLPESEVEDEGERLCCYCALVVRIKPEKTVENVKPGYCAWCGSGLLHCCD